MSGQRLSAANIAPLVSQGDKAIKVFRNQVLAEIDADRPKFGPFLGFNIWNWRAKSAQMHILPLSYLGGGVETICTLSLQSRAILDEIWVEKAIFDALIKQLATQHANYINIDKDRQFAAKGVTPELDRAWDAVDDARKVCAESYEKMGAHLADIEKGLAVCKFRQIHLSVKTRSWSWWLSSWKEHEEKVLKVMGMSQKARDQIHDDCSHACEAFLQAIDSGIEVLENDRNLAHQAISSAGNELNALRNQVCKHFDPFLTMPVYVIPAVSE